MVIDELQMFRKEIIKSRALVPSTAQLGAGIIVSVGLLNQMGISWL
jgi:hypothetical protein